MAKTTPIATTPTTKMARARTLYDQVVAKPAPEGKTHRGIFMERASELELSAKAANTYFQNIKNEREGAVAAPAVHSIKDDLNALRTMATDLNKEINRIAKQVA